MKVPEPADGQHVEFELKVCATIGELRRREAGAFESMRAALLGITTGTHTPAQAEEAIRACADARFALYAAIGRAQGNDVADAITRELRQRLRDPLRGWKKGRG